MFLATLTGDGAGLVYADKVESEQIIRYSSGVGDRRPLHATASGKAILAFLPAPRRAEILGSLELVRYTERTIATLPALRASLEDVRRTGVCINVEEIVRGACGIAAPIFDHRETVLGACAIGGPTDRVRPRLRELAAEVKATAETISRRLGWRAEETDHAEADHFRRLAHHRAARHLPRTHRWPLPRPRTPRGARRHARRPLRHRRDGQADSDGAHRGRRKRAEELTMFGGRFEEMHRGGWDPEARLADQDRDGVAAEILYPTVGMLLCNHPDFDFKHACFEAYNLWIAEYAAAHPDRLLGIGQTAMRSVDDGIRDLRRIKELGLRGVMMPGNPAVADYDDAVYDPFWEAAIDLGLPLSFHILTSRDDSLRARGPKINAFMSIIRGCQDIIGLFVFSGVFARHPKLRLVCVEADAGWVPHFMYRMDHAWKRHRYWLTGGPLTRMPSEYFREHVYTTFQDDWVAFQVKDLCNVRRLMWANDFPHSDSTWPILKPCWPSRRRT